MKNEVDTRAIIAELFDSNDVFVPHVCGERMSAVRLDCIERLSGVDRLGNVFSDAEASENVCKAPDVTLVPMLAFDGNLFRLGYGGGFYDKFLSESSTLKVGLAFDEQQTDDNFVEKFDVPLDVIITPTRVIRR
jgi:5-formyltetrahydrofolate cyclo-ligase